MCNPLSATALKTSVPKACDSQVKEKKRNYNQRIMKIAKGTFTPLVLSDEVEQWLGHRIADRKVSSSSPALPTVLRVRDISNLSSHTVHSAECTGNCA